MSVLMRWGGVACILVFGLMVLAFFLENQEPSSLQLFGWSTPFLPISVFIRSSLLAGMLIGSILTWLRFSIFRKK